MIGLLDTLKLFRALIMYYSIPKYKLEWPNQMNLKIYPVYLSSNSSLSINVTTSKYSEQLDNNMWPKNIWDGPRLTD